MQHNIIAARYPLSWLGGATYRVSVKCSDPAREMSFSGNVLQIRVCRHGDLWM